MQRTAAVWVLLVSQGGENKHSHWAKPGEFHTAGAMFFCFLLLIDKMMFVGFFWIAFLKICLKGVYFSWNSSCSYSVRQERCAFHYRAVSNAHLKEQVSRMPLGSHVWPTELAGQQGALAGSGEHVSSSSFPVLGALMPCYILPVILLVPILS